MSGQFELTWDGKKILVTEFEISYSPGLDDYQKISIEGILQPYENKEGNGANFIQDEIVIKEANAAKAVALKEIERMCRDNGCDNGCKSSAEDGYGGERLVRKIKELDLTDDQRMLRKYSLVNEVGTVTSRGKEVLLNHLMDLYGDDIVEDLKALEESEKTTQDD